MSEFHAFAFWNVVQSVIFVLVLAGVAYVACARESYS